MTIYERLNKILATYRANQNACKSAGLVSAEKIIGASIASLESFIGDMPVDIAEMYAGENE